ncbi:MAG: response regulator [Chloroflexi bacterium]|nr:response regulator [Chloroflexota bacterium]
MKPTKSTLRYVRVADEIRQSIIDGVISVGEQLPRQHELAKLHNVAFNTLKQALDLLSDEGYLIRKVGQGTFATLPEDDSPTALVVDDEPQIRELLTRALRSLDWQAIAVESGEAALQILETRSFDLIFLDLAMSGMNGAQTFKFIRDRDPTAQVAIVTGFPDSQLMATALATGPFAVMSKPFTLDELRNLLNSRAPR